MIHFLALITSISIAGVAAWYSIIGLMAIFAAAAIPIAIMGAVLEVGKLVTASWLYQNWRETNFLLKSYLTISVVVLMFVTSMGIFGFLSKAHIEQTLSTGDNSLQISLIDSNIKREQRRITSAETVIDQLDKSVQTLIDYDRIRGNEGAIATREKQKEERILLNSTIEEAAKQIAILQSDKLVLEKEQLQLEAEVGPIKYIAALVYDDTSKQQLEEAVRWVIITIIFVFDPLAVLLLLAANQGLSQTFSNKKESKTFFEKFEDAVNDEPEEDSVPLKFTKNKHPKRKYIDSGRIEIDKDNLTEFK